MFKRREETKTETLLECIECKKMLAEWQFAWKNKARGIRRGRCKMCQHRCGHLDALRSEKRERLVAAIESGRHSFSERSVAAVRRLGELRQLKRNRDAEIDALIVTLDGWAVLDASQPSPFEPDPPTEEAGGIAAASEMPDIMLACARCGLHATCNRVDGEPVCQVCERNGRAEDARPAAAVDLPMIVTRLENAVDQLGAECHNIRKFNRIAEGLQD